MCKNKILRIFHIYFGLHDLSKKKLLEKKRFFEKNVSFFSKKIKNRLVTYVMSRSLLSIEIIGI